MSYLRPKVILSSPFRRCLQTVEPLAEGVGLRVVEDERFTPGHSSRCVRNAFSDVAANSVVCTPGEAISQLFDDP